MKESDQEQTGNPKWIIESSALRLLFEVLQREGYQLVGPTIRQEAIVYDRLESANDLPIGWTDEQEAGSYRLKRRPDQAWFGYAVGPHSWKKYLFPSRLKLWTAKREGNDFSINEEQTVSTKYAFIGVRSCELHAIAIQDRVFMGQQHTDPHYRGVREGVFIVALNCGVAGGTCFCVSMQTGPQATTGYDLALTEVIDGSNHYFVVDIGSEAGGQALAEIPRRVAEAPQIEASARVVEETAQNMGRSMNTRDIKDLLYRNYEHPRWDNVASRCLTCANCTLVCPTCFCSSVEDTTEVTGQQAERWRQWDSCFTVDFSYLHGGSVRTSSRSRYRQWMTHKLATWFDQFGTSGCVGCGRCISWCPVGIDITVEVQAIRDSEGAPPRQSEQE
ncbi:MAG: 4Fe-4S dicluster domain-containing protein [Dehalococcoidia bacterium]